MPLQANRMNKGETTNCLTFKLLGIFACNLLYINQLVIFPMQELITLCQSMTYEPCAKNLKPFLIP